jgi:hypothetical protein
MFYRSSKITATYQKFGLAVTRGHTDVASLTNGESHHALSRLSFWTRSSGIVAVLMRLAEEADEARRRF